MSKIIKVKLINESSYKRENFPNSYQEFISWINDNFMKGKDNNFMNNYRVNYKFIEESTKKAISNEQDFQYIKNNFDSSSIKIIISPQYQLNVINPGKLYTNVPNLNQDTAIAQINKDDNKKNFYNNSEIIKGIMENNNQLKQKENEQIFNKQPYNTNFHINNFNNNYYNKNINDNNNNIGNNITEQIKNTISNIVNSKFQNLKQALINDIYNTVSQNEEYEILNLNNINKNNSKNILMSNIKRKEEESVHIGISCNNCNCENIIGPRYKCTVCPNYNLCSKCEEISNHDINHIFVKIKKPNYNEKLNIDSTLTYKTEGLNFSFSPAFLRFKRDSVNIQDILLTNTGRINWKKGFYFKCLEDFSELIGNKVIFNTKLDPGKEIHVQLSFEKKKNEESLSQINKNDYVSYWQMFTDDDEPFGECAKLVININD